MSTPTIKAPPEFESAPSSEKIEFIQSLWDEIARDPSSVEVPAFHKEILEKRLAELRENPDAAEPWAELRTRLLLKLRS